MGGQTSIETKKDEPLQTILNSFCKNIKKEIDVLIKNLNEITQTYTLSLNNEHLLGQNFSRIEIQVTNLQNQINKQKNPLMLVKLRELSTFFLTMEWNISDIKNDTHPNWNNVYPIIDQIQIFMKHWTDREEKTNVLRKIKEIEQKLQIVNRKLKRFPSES